MQSQPWREASLVILFLVTATVVISATGADLAVSSHFYQAGSWPVGTRFPWNLFYWPGPCLPIILAVFGLCAACYGTVNPRWHNWRRQGIFLVLLLALGPGLLVNGIFKDHWGRPRPHQVMEFGGKKAFLTPWQPAFDAEGRSFPSGHASAAFYMTAPYFIYRRHRPKIARRWLAGGIAFGLLMGYARIAQGAHFLSDILWAWGMVYLTAVALSSLVLQKPAPVTDSAGTMPRWRENANPVG